MSAQDSYFGQTGYSFYGGPNGQSFSIKKVFSNKKELDGDITLSSNVGPGDYAIINYYQGSSDDPNENYEDNVEKDKSYSRTYNATLWQRQFTASELKYVLIADFDAKVPDFEFITEEVIPGEYTPYSDDPVNYITDNGSTFLIKKYKLKISKPWGIAKGTDTVYCDPGVLGPNPQITIDRKEDPSDPEGEESDDTQYIHFKIPRPWNLAGGSITPTDPGALNNFSVSTSTNETADTQYINLSLPKPWNISISKGANTNPSVGPSISEVSSSDPTTTKSWQIQLPDVWGIAIGTEDQYCNPGETSPTISINGSPNNPASSDVGTTTKYIHFKIPRPWDISISKGDNTRPIDGPSISAIEDSSETTKSWQIQLPDVWKIMLGEDTGYYNPGNLEDPTISINGSKTLPDSEAEGTTTKYIHFKLPKPWKFAIGTSSQKKSTDNPTIVINHNSTSDDPTAADESDEYYYFHFGIPPAQKFDDTQYGSAFTFNLLNANSSYSTTTSFNPNDDYKEYPKVSVNLPLPKINSSYIDPYYQDVSDNKFKNKNPTIASSEDNWTINVGLVKSPILTMDLSAIPSNAPFSFNTQQNNTGITWIAKIPKGTRIIYSDSEPSQTYINDNNIMSGDFYIDKNKDLYEYSTTFATEWIKRISLSGNSLSIREDISINENQLGPETNLIPYQKFGTFVENNYPDLVSSLKTNEVLNILYHPNNDNNIEYHWLYKLASGNWSGSQITGSVSNTFIKNNWQSDSSQETYSITRINELRNQVNTNTTNISNITTKSFNLTILQSNWNYTMPGYYTNIVTLNPSSETLHCGVDNKVPPLIYHGSTAINLYNLLDAVQVSDNRKSLTFFVKDSDYANINADIPVIVIDHR